VFSPLGKLVSVTPRVCQNCGTRIGFHWAAIIPLGLVAGAAASLTQAGFSLHSSLYFGGVLIGCVAAHIFLVPLVARRT
jgi:hypothetical protein